MNCNHTFVYHSVVPPSRCPLCGACLGCGSRPQPPVPPPHWVQPWFRPYYYTSAPNTAPVVTLPGWPPIYPTRYTNGTTA